MSTASYVAARQTRVGMAAGLVRIRAAAEETGILEASIDQWSWVTPSGVAAAEALQSAVSSMDECVLLCRGMAPPEVKAWSALRTFVKSGPPAVSTAGTFESFWIAGSEPTGAGSSAADSWFRADGSAVAPRTKPRPPMLPSAEVARIAAEAAAEAIALVGAAGAKAPPQGMLRGTQPQPPPPKSAVEPKAKGPPSGFSGFSASAVVPEKAMPQPRSAVPPFKATPAGSSPPPSSVTSSWQAVGAASQLPIKAPPLYRHPEAPRFPF
jgi:hypothetical protein